MLNFSAAFNQVISECNMIMQNIRDSIKATSKWAKHQIQKGTNSERATRYAYAKTCDYLDIFDKKIHIHQRVLAYQSKALSHMLQRDLYVMSNVGLVRRDAERTHLQPDLGETRCPELRNSAFSLLPLFYSQLVKEGEEFLLNKGTS